MSTELLDLFRERAALLEGHFQLSSGLHSPRYLQCALVLADPPVATRLGEELADLLLRDGAAHGVTTVVAPALGGILVAHEVARALGVRSMFTERQDGAMTLRRGFTLSAADRVVVVEDVITTGGSTREVIDAVKAQGAQVLAAGSLVDRSGGAAEVGVSRRSLLAVDVPLWPAGSCPLCAAGGVAVKPGSRPAPRA
jgi:orotate phosphoribosyltransferase